MFQSSDSRSVIAIPSDWWSDATPVERSEVLERVARDYQTVGQIVDGLQARAMKAARAHLASDYVAPRTSQEKQLADIWASVLKLEYVGIHDSFFDLGGDSILAIQVISRARRADISITLTQFLAQPTVAELASLGGAEAVVEAEQEPVTGPAPLIPSESAFLEANLEDSHHWNQAVLLQAAQPLDADALKRAVEVVVSHHDALRSRFKETGGAWKKTIAESEQGSALAVVDLTGLSPDEQTAGIEKGAAELQASFDLESGPILKVGLFELGEGLPQRLLVAVHHLAVDGYSWRVLLEDLKAAYLQAAAHSGSQGSGEAAAPELPPRTTSIKRWGELLKEYAASSELEAEMAHWSKVPPEPVKPLPRDLEGGSNTEATARAAWVPLSPEETRMILHEIPATYGTKVLDVMLAGLVRAFAPFTGERSLLLDLVVHGREDLFPGVDLSRTVGWFTTTHPVFLDLRDVSSPPDELRAAQAQLARTPRQGIGYGVLRYMNDKADVTRTLGSLATPEILFSYVGQFEDSLADNPFLRLAPEPAGEPRSSRARRGHLLAVGGLVIDQSLRLAFMYSEDTHSKDTISGIANHYVQALRVLGASCREDGLAASDLERPIDIQWQDKAPTQVMGNM